MKKNSTLFAILIILVLSNTGFGQKKKTTSIKLTGREYDLNDDVYVPFKYTRSFSMSADNFITTYKIYNPHTGDLFQIITATNIVSEKKVVVDVVDANGGMFAHIHSEETSYQSPSLEPFGFRGSAGAIGGNRVPNQLMVKFLNNKFQYIKVMNIDATPSDTDNYFDYILDK
jgi:hypothetical protein